MFYKTNFNLKRYAILKQSLKDLPAQATQMHPLKNMLTEIHNLLIYQKVCIQLLVVLSYPSLGVAKFPLKFLTGTRKSCVTLRFVVQVKTASNAVTTIESNASQPFIVITNDCQWEGSEGTLLKNEAFSDQVCNPWVT